MKSDLAARFGSMVGPRCALSDIGEDFSDTLAIDSSFHWLSMTAWSMGPTFLGRLQTGVRQTVGTWAIPIGYALRSQIYLSHC